MPWTTPTDRASGYTVTNTNWNENLGVSGNTAYLYGDTGWSGAGTLTFTNAWVDFGGASPLGYRRIGTRVVFKGAIKTGTIGSAAFTLPAGYRPTQNLNFACDSNAAFGHLSITSAGVVTPTTGSNVWFSLDNISFDTI